MRSGAFRPVPARSGRFVSHPCLIGAGLDGVSALSFEGFERPAQREPSAAATARMSAEGRFGRHAVPGMTGHLETGGATSHLVASARSATALRPSVRAEIEGIWRKPSTLPASSVETGGGAEVGGDLGRPQRIAVAPCRRHPARPPRSLSRRPLRLPRHHRSPPLASTSSSSAIARTGPRQASRHAPPLTTDLDPRQTTNPPVPCLGRPLLAQKVNKGQALCSVAPTAPPGGRFWHGFAVPRPPLGGGGRGLTFGLAREKFGRFQIDSIRIGFFVDNRGMERKLVPSTFFTERSLAALRSERGAAWARLELDRLHVGPGGDVETLAAVGRDEAVRERHGAYHGASLEHRRGELGRRRLAAASAQRLRPLQSRRAQCTANARA